MAIRHQTFTTSMMDMSLTQHKRNEEFRAEAEAFLNEIGRERIIAVTESATDSRVSVVVWYQE